MGAAGAVVAGLWGHMALHGVRAVRAFVGERWVTLGIDDRTTFRYQPPGSAGHTSGWGVEGVTRLPPGIANGAIYEVELVTTEGARWRGRMRFDTFPPPGATLYGASDPIRG